MTQRNCSVEGCERTRSIRQWCGRHYQRWRQYGDPLAGGPFRERAAYSKICSIDGCEDKHWALGLCRLHWQRQRKTGDPQVDVPKRRWGQQSCEFPGCDEPHVGKGFCHKHWQRQHKHGDPNHVEKPGWRDDEVGYTAMHERIYRMRGPAIGYICRRCGRPADDWAYDHTDPNERQELGKGPYSTDPAHYMPLCRSCHMKLDHNGWED